jgi:K+-transporting ATPase c subunit
MRTKDLLLEVKTSVLVTLVLLIILCALYPLVVWGVSQLIFPR